MPTEPLKAKTYPVRCPNCGETFYLSLLAVTTQNFSHCPECHERVPGSQYYERDKLLRLMSDAGYPNGSSMISVNDKAD